MYETNISKIIGLVDVFPRINVIGLNLVVHYAITTIIERDVFLKFSLNLRQTNFI